MPLRARTPYTRHLSGGGGGTAEEESRTPVGDRVLSRAGDGAAGGSGREVGYAAVGGPRVPAAAPANNHNDSVAR